MSIFSKLFTRIKSAVTNIESKGSAFVRVAEHDTAVKVAQGKIIALKAAEEVTGKVLSELEAAAQKIHAQRDALDARLLKIHASL